MIYVTGDTHSDFQRFSTRIFPEQKDMSKDDYMIICGDFGNGLFYPTEHGPFNPTDNGPFHPA